MPGSLTERVPLPNLKAYLALSVTFVSMSVYHAVKTTADPKWRSAPGGPSAGAESPPQPDTRPLAARLAEMTAYMLLEPACIWTLINMAYCCLFILGRSIQRVVFGELRESERQNVKDKFWNFIFYKFIFVFGVINVQFMDEVVLWCAWFSAVGFLQLLAQLCKDRFEYLSFSSSFGGWAGARLAALLAVVFSLAIVLLMLCGAVAYYGGGFNTFAFMAAECILLSIRTLHVIFRYFMHVIEAQSGREDGSGLSPALPSSSSSARDLRTPAVYYTELSFELAALVVDLLHHLHMLLWSNIFLSMASLVICMQLRYLFHEIQRRIKKHRNYLWVLNHMEKTYPMATSEELAENSDNCAICWEKLESARKLPCSHLFHNSCLSSWLQQDTSCPTCRLRLSLWPPSPPINTATLHTIGHNSRLPNHFFHFDGSRYVSWLPSFSVEVTHMMRAEQQVSNSQMDAMARQVQQLFPHYPLPVILQDLQSTRSMEVTIENILDGRLLLPPHMSSMSTTPIFDNTLHAFSGIPVLPAVLLTQALTPSSTPPSTPEFGRHRIIQYQLPLVPAQPDHYQTNALIRNNVEMNSQNHEHHDDHVPVSGRFSKCSHERERILQIRKDQLLHNARKKFLERRSKHNISNESNDEAGPSESEQSVNVNT